MNQLLFRNRARAKQGHHKHKDSIGLCGRNDVWHSLGAQQQLWQSSWNEAAYPAAQECTAFCPGPVHLQTFTLEALSLEGVSQMVYILPERLLALVRPAFDLVLRRIRSLKRCAQACGCKIETPRYAPQFGSRLHFKRANLCRAKKKQKKRKQGVPKKGVPEKKGKGVSFGKA